MAIRAPDGAGVSTTYEFFASLQKHVNHLIQTGFPYVHIYIGCITRILLFEINNHWLRDFSPDTVCAEANQIGPIQSTQRFQYKGKPTFCQGRLRRFVRTALDVTSERRFMRIFFRRTGLDILSGRCFVKTAFEVFSEHFVHFAYLCLFLLIFILLLVFVNFC